MWEGLVELGSLENPWSLEKVWRLLCILCGKMLKVSFSPYSYIHPRSCNTYCLRDMHCCVHGEKQVFSLTSLQYKEHRFLYRSKLWAFWGHRLSAISIKITSSCSTIYVPTRFSLSVYTFPIFCLHQYLSILLHLLLSLLSLSVAPNLGQQGRHDQQEIFFEQFIRILCTSFFSPVPPFPCPGFYPLVLTNPSKPRGPYR